MKGARWLLDKCSANAVSSLSKRTCAGRCKVQAAGQRCHSYNSICPVQPFHVLHDRVHHMDKACKGIQSVLASHTIGRHLPIRGFPQTSLTYCSSSSSSCTRAELPLTCASSTCLPSAPAKSHILRQPGTVHKKPSNGVCE